MTAWHQIDGLYLLLLVVPISMGIAMLWSRVMTTLLFGRNTLPRKRDKWETVPEFHLHTPIYHEPSAISPAARRFPGRVRTGMSSRATAVV